MIAVLMTVKLQSAAERRVGKTSGREYVTARAHSQASDGARVWCKLTAFSAEAGAALLALKAGDAVAVVGSAALSPYTDRGGEAAASIDLVVDQVLSLYSLDKRRRQAARSPAESEFNDAVGWED